MHYRIAVCDDSDADRQYIAALAARWAEGAGHTVQITAFSSAEEFLFRYAEKSDYDILLLDIEMGEMDAGKTHAGFKGTQAVDKGGGRARHLGAVQGQENGRSQQASHMGRGAGAAYVAAVEKSAVALNE